MRLLKNLVPLSNLTLLLFLALSTLTISTGTSSSFCKCICHNASMLIDLNPDPKTQTLPPSAFHVNLLHRDTPHHALSCADCNRAFCLSYDLPTCNGAHEEDIFTTCFQRDSLKDETVVFLFVFATAGLLAWALLRPWVEKLWAYSGQQNTYIPVTTDMQPRRGFGLGGTRENISRPPAGPRGDT